MSSAKEPVTFKLNTTRNLIASSVRTCYKQGLEHDQITVNQMGNKATATKQLDNQKFIHEPMTLYQWKLSH